MVELDVVEMAAAIEALQRVMVRLENDMLLLKAATPEARFKMFGALQSVELESDKRDAEFSE
jgi:hypothetical protein